LHVPNAGTGLICGPTEANMSLKIFYRVTVLILKESAQHTK